MLHGKRPGTAEPVRGIAALCCWALLLVVLLPVLILQSLDARLGAALAVQCVVVVHTGAALARVLTDVRARLIAFGFWLFSYVWLGLAPLAMLATDAYPRGFVVDANTAFVTTAVVETGLLAYSAGSAVASWRSARTSTVLEPLLARRLSPGRVLLLCGLALLLAVALIPGQGGLSAFFLSRRPPTRRRRRQRRPRPRTGRWPPGPCRCRLSGRWWGWYTYRGSPQATGPCADYGGCCSRC